MRRTILITAIAAFCALQSCSKKANQAGTNHDSRTAEDTGSAVDSAAAQVHLLQSEENQKYGLAVDFYGVVFRMDNGTRSNVVQYLTIKDLKHGTETRYSPTDAPSLNEPGGFFSGVWSPDKELLALPLGRFDGFCILRSAEAVRRIGKGDCNDTIRVQMKDGTRLWHEFGGWKTPDSFDFTAGLSGNNIPFSYRVPDRRLAAQKSLNSNFTGVNSKGKIPIRSLMPSASIK